MVKLIKDTFDSVIFREKGLEKEEVSGVTWKDL